MTCFLQTFYTTVSLIILPITVLTVKISTKSVKIAKNIHYSIFAISAFLFISTNTLYNIFEHCYFNETPVKYF